MMSATTELDPVFRYALKLLHSPNEDSAEKIRNALDDLIKQRHGANKMLANTLHKKYLAEESSAPGSGAAHRRHSHKSSDSKASISSKSSGSPVHISTTITTDSGYVAPIIISVPDDDDDDDVIMEDDHLKVSIRFFTVFVLGGVKEMITLSTIFYLVFFVLQGLEDLMCLVCHSMDVSARNRLIECAECHSLYHQDCHHPRISDSDANEQEFSWCCSSCKEKIKSASLASPAKSSSSHSSSSSSSSSYNKPSAGSKSYEPSSLSTVINPTSSSAGSSSSKVKSSSSSSKHTSSSKVSSSSHTHSGSGSGRDRERDRDISTGGGTSGGSGGSNGGSSSGKSTVTPSINIISADKRLQNMKKKAAAKMQESRRKHK